MKPHAIRRLLFTVNVALGLAAAGLVAWFVADVRPAVAAVVDQDPNQLPERYEALIKDYEQERRQGLKWAPKPPVSEEEMRAVILREDYRKKRPAHWIFCGPLPPPDLPDAPPEEIRPAAPTGLEALGKPSFVVFSPPDLHTVSFRFNSGTTEAFRIGQYIREKEGSPGRFLFKDLQETKPFLYDLLYDVLEEGKVVREGKLTYDSRPVLPDVPWLRSAGQATGTTPAAAGSGAPAAAGTTPAGEGEVPAAAEDAGSEVAEASTPIVIAPNTEKPPEEGWRLEDLRPEIQRESYTKRAVVFDQRTFDYFRGKNADSVARSVKTQVATDEKTGRTLGLRITGFDQDAPADVFDVKRGDILVSINDRPVTSREDVVSYVQTLKEEALVKVVLERNGKLITYMVDPRDPRTRRSVRYFENLKD